MTARFLKKTYGEMLTALTVEERISGLTLGLGETEASQEFILMIEVTPGKPFILGYLAPFDADDARGPVAGVFYPLSTCCLWDFSDYTHGPEHKPAVLCQGCADPLADLNDRLSSEDANRLQCLEPQPLTATDSPFINEPYIIGWLERLGLDNFEATMVGHRLFGVLSRWNGSKDHTTAWSVLEEMGDCFG